MKIVQSILQYFYKYLLIKANKGQKLKETTLKIKSQRITKASLNLKKYIYGWRYELTIYKETQMACMCENIII